jgi:hypothetical protein
MHKLLNVYQKGSVENYLKGTYLVLKGVRCSSAHFKSETSISHRAASVNLINNPSHQVRKVKGVLCKIGASVRCWMDVPDLKCAREHCTPLSTGYVPLSEGV